MMPTKVQAIQGLDAAHYPRHALHASHALWTEKNCYIDLWIEILHAKGLEPLAMLPFVAQMDFEGDQWTFFKPSHDELRSLYGIKVHELTVWKPLLEHALEHLSAGRLICVEVDAYYLPDTQGTDYRHKHSKTTIAINAVDTEAQELGYFHNAGYFVAQGEDYHHLLPAQWPASGLPLFAELVSFYDPPVWQGSALKQASKALMGKHVAYAPLVNPVIQFAHRFAQELPKLQASGLDNYHAWAFAGIRQWGAASELQAAWLEWLHEELPPAAQPVHALLAGMAMDAKTLILKGARAVVSKKAFDPVAQLAHSAAAWDQSMAALRAAFPPPSAPLNS
ncbi:DUF1839 family protein [Rhodoferax aquaticus]|uniref:DUF1839 family protein n=1 Tax=Rhodoferax aquaticus TaxID=2527691 RepID=A0A515ETB7_9BURK|nr:DUF1839 family protein [Rhodoferax aquaticus]QDL55813.1 DUF1839 family protein [Rhodoferax aquaticus]